MVPFIAFLNSSHRADVDRVFDHGKNPTFEGEKRPKPREDLEQNLNASSFARNRGKVRTVCLRWGKYFFRTLLSNVMKSVINGKFVGNDFRWHLEVHERPCGCQDSSPRIFTSLHGGEPHIKGSRSSK